MNEVRLSQILSELQTLLEELYQERLKDLFLYGSYARGDAECGSDIDILVVLSGPVSPVEEIHRSSDIVTTLSLKYDTVISCVFIDKEQFVAENSPFLINVRREGVPL